ncbi:hypothetical protein HanIR_Chr15g0755951 [Helianthus annuus]|nr:hypothetical protein HanIR_Chr15g0755951 [Helianthus annuus]
METPSWCWVSNQKEEKEHSGLIKQKKRVFFVVYCVRTEPKLMLFVFHINISSYNK